MTQKIHDIDNTLYLGSALEDARWAVILLHGRGSNSRSMQGLVNAFPQGDIAYLLPQATNQSWYPHSGFLPFEKNEPYLSAALDLVQQHINKLQAASIPPQRIILGGFSQGACLSAEFVARGSIAFKALLLFSGALLGPLEEEHSVTTPLPDLHVFVGGIQQDPWIEEAKLRQTIRYFEERQAQVKHNIIMGHQHMIRLEEVEIVLEMLENLFNKPE